MSEEHDAPVDETPTEPVATQQASDKFMPQTIEKEMRKSYLDYAMSVIVSRALPDARDGLKPVHRRILYAMSELGLGHTSAYKKSARVVGEVLGKYHPHGDSSIYDAMVRMAQDWSLRYPLVQGQGNFGSIDGDSAAAMRYTEARMEKLASRMLADIDKETIKFRPNFDASLEEPSVLPAMVPNLLINGSDGIAVGMATKMAPHHIGEVCLAAGMILENPEVSPSELLEVLPGPDFPTGGIIYGRTGPYHAAVHGKGRIVIRGKHHIETTGDRDTIIFDEIPYQQNKATILIHIANLVKDKIIDGISDLRDESDRTGMRMVIELKRDAITDVVLNQLWKFTTLQSAFNINNLALVNGRPQVMGNKRLLEVFLDHRREIVDNRTKYDLRKAQERLHILDGLITAVDNIDEVIKIIRGSDDVEIAKAALMERFGLSELQSKAILDMTLRKLTGLEQNALRTEADDLRIKVAEYLEILANPKLRDGIIGEELRKIREEFGDERRTVIEDSELEVDLEDLIPREESVYMWTKAGYLKRMPLADYREQNRGGKGLKGMKAKEEDYLVGTTVGSSHDTLCIFTNHGRLHWLKGYRVPIGSRQAKGKPIQNLVQFQEGERLETIIPVADFDQEKFLFFVTRNGIVKRTALRAYSNVRSVGIKAVDLRDGDELLAVRLTDGNQEIILATRLGMACRFAEGQVRMMGRVAAGVRGIRLSEGDAVASVAIAEAGSIILTVTENGFGKRTYADDYRLTKRGAKGVRTIVVDERNGPVVAIRVAQNDEGVLILSQNGMVVRTPVDQIKIQGRNTKGVRVMRMAATDVVSQVVILAPGEVVEAEGLAEEAHDEPEEIDIGPEEADDVVESSDENE